MSSAYSKIAVITTSRADYGIYRPLLAALRDAGHELHILAGGTHPLPAFGHTLDEIRGDAFGAVHVVSHQADGDQPVDLCRSAGGAVTRFADALASVQPDLCFVLGDRYEMLAAGLAAAMMKIPLAHLHGGDITEGSTDDQFRHALTKLSHIHFPAIEEHAVRIRAMGEEAWRVTAVGSLALDGLAQFSATSLQTLARGLPFDLAAPLVVMIFHPEPLGDLSPAEAFAQVAQALADFDGNLLLLGVNADAGYAEMSDAMHRFAEQRPRTAIIASLPQAAYWSWLSHAAALVGNSSSGIIEAPTLRLPVVNIGERQRGRQRAANVIDTPCEAELIAAAIQAALSPAFRESLKSLPNPYGDGHTAQRVVAIIESLPEREVILRKRWASS